MTSMESSKLLIIFYYFLTKSISCKRNLLDYSTHFKYIPLIELKIIYISILFSNIYILLIVSKKLFHLNSNFSYWIEAKTNKISESLTKPNQPTFSWEILGSVENSMRVKINWIPDLNGNPGSHFFVQYRMRGIREWNETDHIDTDDYVIIDDLSRRERYEFKAISVEGDLMAESEIQDVFIG